MESMVSRCGVPTQMHAIAWRVPVNAAHQAIDFSPQRVDDDPALPVIGVATCRRCPIAVAVLQRLGRAPGVNPDQTCHKLMADRERLDRHCVDWTLNSHD
jgi:hypothetical protein